MRKENVQEKSADKEIKRLSWVKIICFVFLGFVLVLASISYPYVKNYYAIKSLHDRGAKIETDWGFLLKELPGEWRSWLLEKIGEKSSIAFDRVYALDLSEMDVTDGVLEEISGYSYLTKVYLSRPDDRFFGSEVSNFFNSGGSSPTKEKLREFTRKFNVSDDGIKYLKNLRQLEFLVLDNSGVSDEGLKHLANLAELKGLSLANTGVNGEGLKHLSRLSNLEALFLSDSDIQDKHLNEIENFKKLNHLSLAGASVTGEGFSSKVNLPDLCRINFCESKFKRTYLDKFLDCKALQELNIGNCTLSNANYDSLQKMKSLTYLIVFKANEDDPRLEHLYGNIQLTSNKLDTEKVVANDPGQMDEEGKAFFEENEGQGGGGGADFEPLMDLIRNEVAPDTWSENSEEGEMTPFVQTFGGGIVTSPPLPVTDFPIIYGHFIHNAFNGIPSTQGSFF